jgi:hypothetical protein
MRNFPRLERATGLKHALTAPTGLVERIVIDRSSMSKKSGDESELLIERYVATFEKLDEMVDYGISGDVTPQLAISEPDEFGWVHWRPLKVNTEASFLEPSMKKFLRDSRHCSSDWCSLIGGLKSICNRIVLLANPPGLDLSRLLQSMSKAPAMWAAVLQAGYIQFAKGPDLDYDAVCFDVSSRKKNGDSRIVKIDHEEILCNNRVKVVAEVAPSFEQLNRSTIEEAGKI